ncbi:MAG: S-adenosylmethionine:tRNA ribosyltransferase-isomerase [Halanaerobium sp. 4-GBenrich]|jgi:S-adenosylmethionine:tRNA ribosyltransferase-isomerase|uniref:S-adenosylmethionine:tRNA ribosyltransferase-isomerase n=1 Tax=Halanaerobium congolense TaxID=54121 RepID=A0A4R7E849_9FIRM|nr:tRNA preQ1(34) S-adenosylmethionine ribosyltransferase-isomerase QueA [Halanaerobium congolense]ODS50240.1 MAG: S-adenosylmethionine:tRNA ribosyltransferase-isomerase [Halanaerobium sp. 4-GBenrich]TDP15658.1 S-adenosylmethionine--tRNA ribosyltransferase-isomerase [Halanaerobium congolense]TDS31150.1 S-adenosylmethionine--tRNA ribosyltransferase-isomerase [Halanaerobium congolense]SDK48607.1 S-adenosylmethionine--tRNA ribosyltransferase-isomerase [Halanaerobium congolense]SDM10889.1 S-adenos
MKVEEFDYHLPEELIAQKPLPKRDESRLMVLNPKQNKIEENVFKNLKKFLDPGDMIIMNNSRVIPARLYGAKIPTGTEIEVLLLNELTEGHWEVLVRPGRRAKKGVKINFNDILKAEVVEYTDFGGRIVEFSWDENNYDFEEILNQLGEMPLPPYINEKLDDPERYQTIYSKKKGSAAAPTAGLHFTENLLNELQDYGIILDYITLHVGLGTFRPVKSEEIEDHEMHEEYAEISAETAAKIKEVKARGSKVIAVGTTVTRTLESAAQDGGLSEYKGWTDIFIYPGYEFKVIDSLITNFHLPKSTLLMLVSALAGKDFILSAYKKAVEDKYRFFSLGDAMLILNRKED